MFSDGVHRVRWLSRDGWVTVFAEVKDDRIVNARALVAGADRGYDLDSDLDGSRRKIERR